jgi:hypothetical protein
MKTITLQGEIQKFENLNQATSNFDQERLPYEVEKRVYVIDVNEDGYSPNMSDEEFQTLSEEQGRVYTLNGFQEAFNDEEINSAIDIIRFINQPINL